jgi:hypothetical protein
MAKLLLVKHHLGSKIRDACYASTVYALFSQQAGKRDIGTSLGTILLIV